MSNFSLIFSMVASVAMQSPFSPLDGLKRCESIDDDASKLSCYQSESARLFELSQNGQLIITTLEVQQRVAAEEFGRRTNSPIIDNLPSINRLETTLSASSVNAMGKRVYSLADGSIWEQTDQSRTRNMPVTGSTVVIRRGALGSFFIKIADSHDVRVRRIN